MGWSSDIENSRGRRGFLTPKVAIILGWIIWAGLIMGELSFMGSLCLLLVSGRAEARGPRPDEIVRILVVANAGMLLVTIPTVYFLRRLIINRARSCEVIRLLAYLAGNIVFWAGCEGCAFFGMVTAFVNWNFWPSIVIVAVAMGIQAAAFPRLRHVKAPEGTFKIE